jgi:hypothetical protein
VADPIPRLRRPLSLRRHFSVAAVFSRTEHGREIMNKTLVRAHGTVSEGWPVLVAYAPYAVAIYICAIVMASCCVVA